MVYFPLFCRPAFCYTALAVLCCRIELHPYTEVTELHGETELEKVAVRHSQDDTTEAYDINRLIVFIGAKPHSEWLGQTVALDEKGFIKTGEMVGEFPSKQRPSLRCCWLLSRCFCWEPCRPLSASGTPGHASFTAS